MKPSTIKTDQTELFKNRLSTQLNPKDPLLILSSQIDWSSFEKEFGAFYKDGPGHPPKPIRLMVGTMMLQHMYGVSDEQVVQQWVHNPYWQYFCGYDFLQWAYPMNASSLTRWRKRLGVEGFEKILSATIQTAIKTTAVAPCDLKRVITDTTVMGKTSALPQIQPCFTRPVRNW